MHNIQIIVASVRPGRVGDSIGGWVAESLTGTNGFTFEIVDLKEWQLPLDGEGGQPKHGNGYRNQRTREWSGKIASGDGYVFVTPQYNWGYPASLKNALDQLYHEWSGKPAVIVSYGHRGGVKAADQLRQVLLGLHMTPAQTMPALFLTDETIGSDGRIVDIKSAFASAVPTLRQAIAEMTFKSAGR